MAPATRASVGNSKYNGTAAPLKLLMSMGWIKQKGDRVVILVQVQTRSSKTEVIGLHGDPPRIRIRVAAPPVDGEANQELHYFLSKKLKVAKSQVELISGQTAKYKEFAISGIKLEQIVAVLLGKGNALAE